MQLQTVPSVYLSITLVILTHLNGSR